MIFLLIVQKRIFGHERKLREKRANIKQRTNDDDNNSGNPGKPGHIGAKFRNTLVNQAIGIPVALTILVHMLYGRLQFL